MKTLLTAPQISADVFANRSVDRFDGLASGETVMVHVEYHIGEFEPLEPAFLVIDKVLASSAMTLTGTEIATGTLTLQIPAGFDITDLLTLSQRQAMEEDLTSRLLFDISEND